MGSGIKFAHLSDIHIGIETHGKINPATGRNTRLEDVLNSLDYIVDEVINKDVDLVLISGDIFHRENPQPTEETEFARRINTIVTGSGAELVIVLGNHDYPSTSHKTAAVEIFPALELPRVRVVKRPEAVTITTKNGPVQVLCLPWIRKSALLTKDEYKSIPSDEIQRELERRMLSIVRNLIEEADKSIPAVFAGHFSVRNAVLSGSETTSLDIFEPSISRVELARESLAYVALGHIHRYQNLNDGSQPPIVYSGSIERIDFSEEREDKGFVMGEIVKKKDGWNCEFQFVKTPARKFFTVEIDPKAENESIGEAPGPLTPEDIEGAIVRVRYRVSDAEERVDEKKLLETFSRASSVKIERIFEAPAKTTRGTGLTKNMDAIEALKTYIDSKPELEKVSEKMIEYARKLAEETESG